MQLVDVSKSRGIDISHYQKVVDFSLLAAKQVPFVIIKATQGTLVDRLFEQNRRGAELNKIRWMPYPFLQHGETEVQARFFAKVVGAKVPAVLDWEASQVSSITVEAFANVCASDLGRDPMAYYGLYPPDKPTPLIKKLLRILPEYSTAPRLSAWDGKSNPVDWSKFWFMWQCTQNGRMPGITTEVDINVLSCPVATFNNWYDTGSLIPHEGPEPLTPLVTPDILSRVLRVTFPLMSGVDVKLIQVNLIRFGLLKEGSDDGLYGAISAEAVRAFQKQHGIPQTGIVDERTYAMMNFTLVGV